MASITGKSKLIVVSPKVYAGEAVINDPAPVEGRSGSVAATLPSVTSSGSSQRYVTVKLPAITCEGSGYAGKVGAVDVDIPSLTASGTAIGENIASADLTIPSIECSGGDGTNADATLPSVEMSSTGIAGNAGKVRGSLPSVSISADGDTQNAASGSMVMPSVSLSITASQTNSGAVSASLKAIALSAEGYTGTVSSGSVTLPVVAIDASGSAENIGSASIEIPVLTVEATLAGNESTLNNGYVLNLANKALTEYDHYPFNSLTVFNGVRLGANSSGIFALTGDTDNGSEIPASAKVFLASSGVMRIREAYVRYRADDDITLVVVPDESDIEAYEYTLTKTPSSGLHRNRVKMGRGLRANSLTMEIKNVSGGDFEIALMEIIKEESNRSR